MGGINAKVAEIFRALAEYYYNKGDRFRGKAYDNGATAILDMGKSLRDIYWQGGLEGLKSISGIGPAMALKIEEFINTGEVGKYKKLGLSKEPEKKIALKGDLQVQTNWTDGAASIEEMARAAQASGLEYIAVTDHTKALAFIGGLNSAKIKKQGKEIDKVNKKFEDEGLNFRILKGAEVDILKDGSLDIDDETLSKLDVVGISIHSHFTLPRDEQTKRVLRALKNPHADIWFHPMARKNPNRPPINIDIEAVFAEAVKRGVLLEINGAPDRLDLSVENIKIAKSMGASFVIDSDSHRPSEFRWLRDGEEQARKAKVPKKSIMNNLPVEEFLNSLKSRR